MMMEVELDLWSSRSDPVDHMLDDVDCCADVDQYLSKHDDEDHDACNDDDLNINSLTNINTMSPYDHVIILNDRLMSESLIASRVDHCYILDDDHQQLQNSTHNHNNHNLGNLNNHQHNLSHNQNNSSHQYTNSGNDNQQSATMQTQSQSGSTNSLNNQNSDILNHSGNHQQKQQINSELLTSLNIASSSSSSTTPISTSSSSPQLMSSLSSITSHDHIYDNNSHQSNLLHQNQNHNQNNQQQPQNSNQQQSIFLNSVTGSSVDTYSQFVSTSGVCSSNQNQGFSDNSNNSSVNVSPVGFSLNVGNRLNHRSTNFIVANQGIQHGSNVNNHTINQRNQTLMNQHLQQQILFSNQQLSTISSSSHQVSKISSSSPTNGQLLRNVDNTTSLNNNSNQFELSSQQQQQQFNNKLTANNSIATTKRKTNPTNSRQRNKVTTQTSNSSITTSSASTTAGNKGRARPTKQQQNKHTVNSNFNNINSTIGDATSTSINATEAVSSAVSLKHLPLSSLVSPPSPTYLTSGILNSQVSPSSSLSSSSSSGISVSFSSSSSSTSSIADSNERHDEQVKAIEDELTTSATSILTISTTTTSNTENNGENGSGDANNRETSSSTSKPVTSTSTHEASSSSSLDNEVEAAPTQQHGLADNIVKGEEPSVSLSTGGATSTTTTTTTTTTSGGPSAVTLKINGTCNNYGAPMSSANLKKIQCQTSALKNVTLTALLNSTSKNHLETITSSSTPTTLALSSSTSSDVISLSVLNTSSVILSNNENGNITSNGESISNADDITRTKIGEKLSNGVLQSSSESATATVPGQVSLSALIASSSSLTGSHPHLNHQLNFQSAASQLLNSSKTTLQQKKSLASLSSCLIMGTGNVVSAAKHNGQNLLSPTAAVATTTNPTAGRILQTNTIAGSSGNISCTTSANKVSSLINGTSVASSIQPQLITSSSSSSSSSSSTSSQSTSPSSVSLISNQDWKSAQSGQIVMLTEEEKRTLIAEGYPIPQRFPLTKAEERSLKKIRRKIKNKISAQESRRKKKEYMEELEKRVQMMEQRIMDLERENFNLKQTIISSASVTGSCDNNITQQSANDALIESILLNHHQQELNSDHQQMLSAMGLSSNTLASVNRKDEMAHDDDDDDDDDDDSDEDMNDEDPKQEQQNEVAQGGDEKFDDVESNSQIEQQVQGENLEQPNSNWNQEISDVLNKSVVAAESSNNKETTQFKPEQIESDQNNGITSSSTDNETDEQIVGSSPKRIKLEVTST